MKSNMKSAGFVYVYFCFYASVIVAGEVFTLGYLTGSQRRTGDLEYAKPGTVIVYVSYFIESQVDNFGEM